MITLIETIAGFTIRPELLWLVELISIAFVFVFIITLMGLMFSWKR